MNETIMEQALFNMIEQQIRPAEVLDAQVLQTIAEVPREYFVPSAYRQLAYSDTHIPLGNGQTMMSPIQEARLLQALNIQRSDTILEIGTGSGYLTALLAKLGKQVISIEIDQQLSKSAAQKLRQHGITNVTLEIGDASKGWGQHAPYDVMAVTGSLPVMCKDLQRQLKSGGRLFVIVGSAPAMSAMLITRISDNQWSEEELFETVIPPLINAEKPPQFVF
ncbi:MAG: protein-L-isoaspartate O-methyltransferase [Gammaproteobacteria bacterium]|nr:protein-L-isoaspartate O-methyltransferase [Gammaproteobacteria bacterium]